LFNAGRIDIREHVTQSRPRPMDENADGVCIAAELLSNFCGSQLFNALEPESLCLSLGQSCDFAPDSVEELAEFNFLAGTLTRRW
jgi:hypothetical protein